MLCFIKKQFNLILFFLKIKILKIIILKNYNFKYLILKNSKIIN